MVNHTEDEMWLKWQEQAPRIYDHIYYNSNQIISYINNSGHRLVEKDFDSSCHFDRVIEVGSGTGKHVSYVKHNFNEYIMTDISQKYLNMSKELNKNEKFKFEIADATNLQYADSSFDRLISIYNLEHLPNPHDVLKEWRRVIKPGGTISISIPTEGGLAWNTGRFLTTRRYFAKEGLNLDYIISREHINTCYRLVNLIHYYFPKIKEKYFPIDIIPTSHLNLIYAVNITV